MADLDSAPVLDAIASGKRPLCRREWPTHRLASTERDGRFARPASSRVSAIRTRRIGHDPFFRDGISFQSTAFCQWGHTYPLEPSRVWFEAMVWCSGVDQEAITEEVEHLVEGVVGGVARLVDEVLGEH